MQIRVVDPLIQRYNHFHGTTCSESWSGDRQLNANRADAKISIALAECVSTLNFM